MKLSTRGETKATTTGGAFLSTCKIAHSKAAFETLSSRLYSDKIRAVIRELSCNAWDAHAAAGKLDTPFEVHLPTDFEPYFQIQDFGTGLSNYNMVNLYCTYFGTNKSDSDKFIGALGLGSKSPFCLTVKDSNGVEEPQGFTVVAIYEGDTGVCPKCGKLVLLMDQWMRDEQKHFTFGEGQNAKRLDYDTVHDGTISYKTAFNRLDTDEFDNHTDCKGVGLMPKRIARTTRIYDALVEDQGPGVRLSAEQETPKGKIGLTIKVDVKQNDIWEYENKAKIVFPFFDPTPKINIEGFALECPRKTENYYSVINDRWGMRQVVATPQGSTVRAIQGNVPYSVGHIDMSRTTDYQKKLLTMPLDLYFPIGSLDPAVSRETLELNERTINSILTLLDEVFVGLMEEVKKKIDACQNSWEARIMIFELSHAEGLGKLVNDAWNTGKLFGKYENFSLDEKKPKLNDLEYEGIQVTRFSHNWKAKAKRAAHETLFTVTDSSHRQGIMLKIGSGAEQESAYDREVEVEPSVLFVVNDLKMGGNKYIHYFVQEAEDNKKDDTTIKKKVYVIARASRHTNVKAVLKQAKKLLRRLGNPEFRLMSEMKAAYSPLIDLRNTAPKVPAERRTIVELKDDFSYYRGFGWRKAWQRSDSQPDGEKKYYIPLDRLRAIESGFREADHLASFVKKVRRSRAFGLTPDTPIYGVRKNSKLRHDPEWVDLVPYVWGSIAGIMTPERELQMTLVLNPFDCDWDDLLDKLAKEKSLSPSSPLQKFAETLAKAKEPLTEQDDYLQELLEMAEERGHYSVGNTIDFKEMWDDVVSQYPIMQGTGDDNMIDYVAMMDERNGIQPMAKAATASQEGSNE